MQVEVKEQIRVVEYQHVEVRFVVGEVGTGKQEVAVVVVSIQVVAVGVVGNQEVPANMRVAKFEGC